MTCKREKGGKKEARARKAYNWESAEVIVGKAHEPKDLMWL